MKGLLIHWSDPWKDIYSGFDAQATALSHMTSAFNLELHVVELGWPFPVTPSATMWPSMLHFLADHKSDAVVLADVQGEVSDEALSDYDYVCMGPPEGWRGSHERMDRWSYSPAPPGGYHALFVAHLAAHIGS